MNSRNSKYLDLIDDDYGFELKGEAKFTDEKQ